MRHEVVPQRHHDHKIQYVRKVDGGEEKQENLFLTVHAGGKDTGW